MLLAILRNLLVRQRVQFSGSLDRSFAMEIVAFLLISANPFSPFLADLWMNEIASFVFVPA